MVGCAYFFLEKHVFVEHPIAHPSFELHISVQNVKELASELEGASRSPTPTPPVLQPEVCAFLATLVALHFTPVSESVSQQVVVSN